MQRQNSDLTSAARFFWVGVFLLLAVFLLPDSSRMEHSSFFALAQHSAWGELFEWAAAWCSAKIILLSLSVLLVLDAFLGLLIRTEYRTACVLLFILAVVSMLLGIF